jgi:hypothetical protein
LGGAPTGLSAPCTQGIEVVNTPNGARVSRLPGSVEVNLQIGSGPLLGDGEHIVGRGDTLHAFVGTSYKSRREGTGYALVRWKPNSGRGDRSPTRRGTRGRAALVGV